MSFFNSNFNTQNVIDISNIQAISDTTSRIVKLNESYKKRSIEYLKILIACIIGIVLYLVLLIINKYYEIPDTLHTILIIIISIIVLIYCGNKYINIKMRDNVDFNTLNLIPPTSATTITGQTASQKAILQQSQLNNNNYILLSNDVSYCSGSNCCASNTIFDSVTQQCIEEPKRANVIKAKQELDKATKDYQTLSTPDNKQKLDDATRIYSEETSRLINGFTNYYESEYNSYSKY
jgi:hypothetical protein